MSFIQSILERIKPFEQSDISGSKNTFDRMRGFGSIDEIDLQRFDRLAKIIDQADRKEVLSSVRDMSREGAIADKALEKLCEDATVNKVTIDAPKQRKAIIESLLDRTGYQKIRKSLLYLMLRDGDLFTQLKYVPSINPNKIGFISRLMVMPAETMIRNTNGRDEFNAPMRAFAQVDDLSNALLASDPIWFPWPKILHARNDKFKGRFFRYGWSAWASGIKIFNMSMMNLEDSAIQRHLAAQVMRVHRIGKESTSSVDSSLISQYQRNIETQLKTGTTDLFIDGKTEIKELGGTSKIMSSVEDIMVTLSILSIAIDYPIDLLSGMISRSSGGEELFRKEVVLKRAVSSIIEKENQEILKPLIDRELFLAGKMGDYRITTIPASFEDQNKRSKRGLMEIQALVKSPRRFHEENNSELSWDEEMQLIEKDLAEMQKLVDKYPDAVKILTRAAGNTDPAAGEKGNTKDPTDQQDRKTQDGKGSEDE